jgi:integrase
MPANRTASPSYQPKYRRKRFKKQRGQAKRADSAFVEIDGQRIHLGVYDSPESREKYERVTAEWRLRGRTLPPPPTPAAKRTVAVIVAAYLKWAETKYRNADGTLRTRFQDTKDAVKPLLAMYSSTPAEEMGAQKLLTIRRHMVDQKLCRKTINERIGIIKRVFRKAVEFELIGPTVASKLKCVEGLASGESDARESEHIEPVDPAFVEAVKPFVSRQVRAVIELQAITGARPSELLNLRLCDLDMSKDVWVNRPKDHKTAHHDKTRTIPFGPRCQQILAEFITGRATDKPLFSPREAEQERLAKLHAERTTPMSCGNKPGSNRVESPRRQPGEKYDEASYRRAIQRACDVADVWAKGGRVVGEDERIIPRWHPYQLRHHYATQMEREHGWRLTQIAMGHSAMSQITSAYVEADESALIEWARKCG